MEYVYTKFLDAIHLDGQSISQFQVEIGSMDYGLVINANEMTVNSRSYNSANCGFTTPRSPPL